MSAANRIHAARRSRAAFTPERNKGIHLKEMLTDKTSILAGIREAVEATSVACAKASEEEALAHPIIDKWSMAEQLVHLIVASRVAGKALAMPGLAFMGIGYAKNGSRTYEEVVVAYQDKLASLTGPTGFEPDLQEKSWQEIQDKWASTADLFEKCFLSTGRYECEFAASSLTLA